MIKKVCVLLVLATSLFAQRLPQTVIPSHYKLSLDPSIHDRKFSGEEVIDVRVNAPITEVVLNSVDLDITDVEITSSGKTQKAKTVYDKPNEMVRLRVSDPILLGEAQLAIKFGGRLTDGLRGLYLSKSARREYAVTQFEGTYARLMFPCFDEPSFKATFDISVMTDKGDTAISNGSIRTDVPVGPERHRITFATSPKMSTYLVALAMGDWQCLSKTVDGVPIRVCAVPERKEYGAFALDVAAHCIDFYNQWYGIKYPFGKVDMVAIPDYEWGGMENTAAIFYRETALLLDEKNASVFRKRGQAITIAHEIAHQWFGDLVTAAWWDDIWLNEGFATWMATKPMAAWHPEWHLEEDEAAQSQRIIGIDSAPSARAIHGNPTTPSEIKEMFDGITYEKGAAVLRMLESYVGPEVFRRGVNAYIAAHTSSNATASDFWKAEAQASGKPVDQIMPSFVMQPGVPLVTLAASCEQTNEKVHLKQERFLISTEHSASSDQRWQIPVCAKTSVGVGVCGLMTRAETTIPVSGCAEWVFGNPDAKGYYRVAYSPNDLKTISRAAEEHLNVPERIALVEDSWALTRAGKTSVADFLGLAEQLRDEQNLGVIESLSGHIQYVRGSLLGSDQQSEFQSFVRTQFAQVARQVGWNSRGNDSDQQKALRAALLEILGGAEDRETVAESRKLVQQFIQNPASVEGTLIGSAFTVVGETGDTSDYDRLAEAFKRSKSSDEYYHYLFALANFRQPALAQRTLTLVDQGKVRQQDYPRFFNALLSNPTARDLAWKYLKDHWSNLAPKVTSFGGAGAISGLGTACSADFHDDVQNFFSSHPAPGAERAVQQSLERIDECLRFKKAQEASLQQWLGRR